MSHTLTIRIYYEDTDFSGFVYHGAYVRFFERGRSEFIRDMGIHHTQMLAGAYGSPSFFVVRHMDITFHAPAMMDDMLEVRTSIHQRTGTRLILQQAIYRGERRLVSAQVEVLCLNSTTHKPIRLPKF